MKIGIIGGGNGGLVTALILKRNWYKQISEMEIYYDPNVPIEKVGQGSVVTFAALLTETTNINWYDNPIDATFKTGILYDGWGTKVDKFIHPFPMDVTALHYSPSKLRELMMQRNFCKFTEANITDPSQVDADIVFDCRGKPKDFTDYHVLKNPLNSVVLGSGPVKPQQLWSDCIATPHGWCFGIPAKNSMNYGYLYNSELTDEAEAASTMERMFGVAPGDRFSFSNYIAKNPIQDDERVFLNGNRLMFIEPMEATSTEQYVRWAGRVGQCLFDGDDLENAVEEYYKEIVEIQNFILWHYAAGSKYDTIFWQKAKEMARSHHYDDKFFDYLNYSKALSHIDDDEIDDEYGQWYAFSFRNWLDNTDQTTDTYWGTAA